MPRYSMNEQTTYRWSFDEDLLHISKAGYDSVGVWLRKLFDFGPERAIELLQESGLGVSSVSWVGGFTGADAATPAENVAMAREAIVLSAELQAESLILYTGGRNGHTNRHSDRLVSSALDKLLPIAEEHGVPIALEPMHPQCAGEWTCLTSLESALRLVEKHRSDSLKISLDTYHFPLEGWDADRLGELIPHLAVVHVGDYVEPRGIDLARVPLGEGTAPLATTLGTLAGAGYDGSFDIKLLGPEIEASDYHELLAQSLKAVTELSQPIAINASHPDNRLQPATPRATRPDHQRAALDPAERVALHLRS